jgi:hypothetical protein
MKQAWALILGLWATVAPAAVIDAKVYDAFGQSYETTNIGERLGAVYDISFEPTLLLILGPDLDDQRVQEQEAIASELAPEEFGMLFAIGTPAQTYSRGFSITPNAAARLLPGEGAFRAVVLGPSGRVLADSQQVLSRDRLIELSPGGP